MPACKACGNPVGENVTACAACGTPVGGPRTLLTKGEIFDGKYEVLDFLGAGGMGELYKVQHIHLQDTRVIKIMRATMAQSDGDIKRFISEARIATRIQHPCVSVLYDFSRLATGNFYMVWEYIPGKDISRVLQACGRMPLPLAARIMRDALEGLDHVHKNGVIHRDISPENLMLYLNTLNGIKVKIIDLGIAKSFSTGEHLTQTGMFMGKLKYCSPEQVGMLEEGEQIDGRIDIYSIGLVLYEMVEGHAPFTSTTPYGYIHKHITTPPAPIILPEFSGDAGERFNAVLMKALEKDRNRRYSTALEFAEALASLNLPPPDPDIIHAYLKPVGFETAHITTPATGSRTVTPPKTPASAPAKPLPLTPSDSGAAPEPVRAAWPAPIAQALPAAVPDGTKKSAISDDTASRPTRRTPPPASEPHKTSDRALMGLEQTYAPEKSRRIPPPSEPTMAALRATPAPARAPVPRERKPFPMVLLAIPVLVVIVATTLLVFAHRTARPSQTPPKSTAAPPTGYLSLHVLPWGRITSLRNEKGDAVTLSGNVTPLQSPLPEGRYTAVIAVGRTSKTLSMAFVIRAGETTTLVRSVPDSSYETFLAQIR